MENEEELETQIKFPSFFTQSMSHPSTSLSDVVARDYPTEIRMIVLEIICK